MEVAKIGIVENEGNFRTFLVDNLVDFGDIVVWKSAEECYSDDSVSELKLVLLDIGLPHMNGIELLKLLKSKYPELKILIISGLNSDDTVFDALKFGANGYIWKSETKNLKECVEIILADGSFMSPSIGVRVMHYFRSKVPPNSDQVLSAREKQVLELVITGFKVNTISDQLGITIGTTRKHINNIYAKLQVSNRIQLLKKANEMGYR